MKVSILVDIGGDIILTLNIIDLESGKKNDQHLDTIMLHTFYQSLEQIHNISVKFN